LAPRVDAGVDTVFEEGGCTDWGIGWHSDLSHHKHSTSALTVLGSKQIGSTEHSDFQ
jgi:hypothetical protein